MLPKLSSNNIIKSSSNLSNNIDINPDDSVISDENVFNEFKKVSGENSLEPSKQISVKKSEEQNLVSWSENGDDNDELQTVFDTVAFSSPSIGDSLKVKLKFLKHFQFSQLFHKTKKFPSILKSCI